ncbi:MAG TPA: hypothetical protein PKD86_16140 [Gemmatales bacterium]|mgnify:CR=1 FL=1|nr:hypothetical protein [Gemmatales bacterium]HMP60876.1 hypothetical protein [Gemmatales bacterium]
MMRWFLAAAVVALALAAPAGAQAQGYFEFHNAMRPGVYTPWEGMNWNQRLNYGYSAPLFAWERGHTPAQIERQIQYDREERAARLQGQRLLWIDRPGPLFSGPPRFLRR